MSKQPPKYYLSPETVSLVNEERKKEQRNRDSPLTFAGFVDELVKIGLRVLARKREKENKPGA